VPFRVEGRDFAEVDRAIGEFLSRTDALEEWLLIKSHYWLPTLLPPEERRVISLYTIRDPADIVRSALDRTRKRRAAEGKDFDEKTATIIRDLPDLLKTYRYVLPQMSMNVISYEKFYGRDLDYVLHIAKLLALSPPNPAAVAAEIGVESIKKWTDEMTTPMDSQSHFRKRHVSDNFGRPVGSLEGLPQEVQDLIRRAQPLHVFDRSDD
jgi:hypothetical protein